VAAARWSIPFTGVSIQYQPFEHTQISLNANQTVNTSYFQNQVNVTTTVGASLSQRLLEKFYLNLGGNYNWNNYTDTAANNSTTTQKYYSVNVSLSTTIFKRVSASVFYSYSDSSTSGQSGPQNGLGFFQPPDRLQRRLPVLIRENSQRRDYSIEQRTKSICRPGNLPCRRNPG